MDKFNVHTWRLAEVAAFPRQCLTLTTEGGRRFWTHSRHSPMPAAWFLPAHASRYRTTGIYGYTRRRGNVIAHGVRAEVTIIRKRAEDLLAVPTRCERLTDGGID